MYRILFSLIFACSLHAMSLRDATGALKEQAKDLLELFEEKVDVDLDELVSNLKENWIQEGVERWNMKAKGEELWEKALPILVDIGCIDAIHAKEMDYDYALVFGATASAMQARLDFLYEEWQRGVRFSQIILLSGERDLDQEREGCPKHLLTEAELLLFLFEHHPLYLVAPFLLVDTPKHLGEDGHYKRPDTAATIRHWLETHPAPGTCLGVSTQPFVGYQGAVLRAELTEEFPWECIGPGVDHLYSNLQEYNPMGICLDTFAKWLIYERLGDKP